MATTFGNMTPGTKRRVLKGMRGQLAHLTEKDDTETTVIIEALATPAEERSRFESRLIARDYYSGDLLLFSLATIRLLERRQWPITDQRHPDYEAPQMVVKPMERRR